MLVCSGLCDYYETYKQFDRAKTYETHKQCTRCGHVVEKKEFPDIHCYCCNAKYRTRYHLSSKARKEARQRKKLKPIVIAFNTWF